MALIILQSATNEWVFTDVADKEEYWHKGDILAYNAESGKEIFIDVKDDKTIEKTNNFLAEHKVSYKSSGTTIDGFMQSAEYDYIAYMSRNDRKMYIIDFAWWRALYKGGIYKIIPHKEQITYCYLNSLKFMKQYGVIIAEIDFHCNDIGNWEVKKLQEYVNLQ